MSSGWSTNLEHRDAVAPATTFSAQCDEGGGNAQFFRSLSFFATPIAPRAHNRQIPALIIPWESKPQIQRKFNAEKVLAALRIVPHASLQCLSHRNALPQLHCLAYLVLASLFLNLHGNLAKGLLCRIPQCMILREFRNRGPNPRWMNSPINHTFSFVNLDKRWMKLHINLYKPWQMINEVMQKSL